MKDHYADAVAVVGLGAIMPEAPNAPAFWENIARARDCISEVDPARWDPADFWDADPSAPDKTTTSDASAARWARKTGGCTRFSAR